MLINNPDALKEWLIAILDPLCDADPICLARYVLALLKKDRPINDLKQCMNEQLNVFLGAQTDTFLNRLFELISTEEYLQKLPSTVNNGNVTTAAVVDVPEQIHQMTPDIHHKTQTTPIQESNSNVEKIDSTARTSLDADLDHVNSSPLGNSISKLREVSPISPVKLGNDNNEHHRRDLQRRRDRSRSRSNTRQCRDKYGPNRHLNYRNKSPSDSDRRKSSNNNNPFRRNSGHEPKSPRYYNPLDSPIDNDEQIGNRSLSPPPKNDRCRDFDEKGYCMRGETCPWDHGINPVVLEDLNNPTLLNIQTSHIRGGGEYNPDVPEIWPQGTGFVNGPNRGALPNATFPMPLAGSAFRVPPFSVPLGPGATTPLQRELISVPVIEANSGGDISASQKRRYEPEDTVAVAEGPAKRKLPINSRLGPPNRIGLQNNCSLELRKVPRGLNSIAHLNNHFCKFGKIVNIQISYEGDPEAAIVTFSTHAEANVAYRSTEAVLNNRFIKVFWHTGSNANATDGNSSAQNSNSTSGAPKDENVTNNFSRKNNQYSLNHTVPANPTPASTEAGKQLGNAAAMSSAPNNNSSSVFTRTSTSPSVIPPTSALATNRVRNNRIGRAPPEAIRKKKEEQVKAAVQLAHGLHKRKHELLQGYIKQMRTCVDLVEKMESSDPQRTNLLTTIKTLQTNIDKLNKEIASDQAQMTAQITPVQSPNAHPFRKSKELQKKELLDMELELIAQHQEGNDTTEIQKRLEELQKSLGTGAKTQFPTVVKAPRVKPAPPGSTSFDRRPTTIIVAGFDSDDCDAVLGHFKHYGEITKNDIDKETPWLRITYATRLNAEQAILRGRRFKDKQLQISWFGPNTEQPKISNEDDLLDEIVPDDALPLEDEEDDDEAESEDRSWRR